MIQKTTTIQYKGTDRAIVLSIPENWDGQKAILDFHGNGEMAKSSDANREIGQLTARSGLPYLIKKGFEIDYLVISPQSWGNNWDMVYAKAVYESLKKEYGFMYCFGVGISMGGRINNYAENYPDDLIATVDFAGVRGGSPSKRLNAPMWTIIGSNDKVVYPQSNSMPYMKQLNEAGGSGHYTCFEGMGHYSSFWNNALNGTISNKQIDISGYGDAKKYIASNFPIGDWFETFIKKEGDAITEKSLIVTPVKITEAGLENAASIFEVQEGYRGSVETPANVFKNDYGNQKREIIADFGQVRFFQKVEWLDLHGKGEWSLYISSDGKGWEKVLADDLGTFKKWHERDIDKQGRFFKVETFGHQLPIRLVFTAIGAGEQQPAKTFSLKVENATEAEKDAIIKLVGEKAMLI